MHRIKRYDPRPTGRRFLSWMERHRRALLIRAAYGAAGGLGSACVTLIVFVVKRHL